MDTDEERFNDITETIIGCAYRVANKLGCGFLEKCYENALAIELTRAGFVVQQQLQLDVIYDGVVVGEFFADLIVNGTVIVELKAIESLAKIHSAQCINYLAATGLPLCLLINFAQRVEVKRFAGRSLRNERPT